MTQLPFGMKQQWHGGQRHQRNVGHNIIGYKRQEDPEGQDWGRSGETRCTDPQAGAQWPIASARGPIDSSGTAVLSTVFSPECYLIDQDEQAESSQVSITVILQGAHRWLLGRNRPSQHNYSKDLRESAEEATALGLAQGREIVRSRRRRTHISGHRRLRILARNSPISPRIDSYFSPSLPDDHRNL